MSKRVKKPVTKRKRPSRRMIYLTDMEIRNDFSHDKQTFTISGIIMQPKAFGRWLRKYQE